MRNARFDARVTDFPTVHGQRQALDVELATPVTMSGWSSLSPERLACILSSGNDTAVGATRHTLASPSQIWGVHRIEAVDFWRLASRSLEFGYVHPSDQPRVSCLVLVARLPGRHRRLRVRRRSRGHVPKQCSGRPALPG